MNDQALTKAKAIEPVKLIEHLVSISANSRPTISLGTRSGQQFTGLVLDINHNRGQKSLAIQLLGKDSRLSNNISLVHLSAIESVTLYDAPQIYPFLSKGEISRPPRPPVEKGPSKLSLRRQFAHDIEKYLGPVIEIEWQGLDLTEDGLLNLEEFHKATRSIFSELVKDSFSKTQIDKISQIAISHHPMQPLNVTKEGDSISMAMDFEKQLKMGWHQELESELNKVL